MSEAFRTTMKQQLGLPRAHTATVEHIIDQIGAVYDMAAHINENAKKDPNLSPRGRQAKVQGFIRDEALRRLAEIGRPMRKALENAAEQRRGLYEMSEPAAADQLENARRAEIRGFLRSLDAGRRLEIALSDPRYVAAALDAPPDVSGIQPALLEDMRQKYADQRVQDMHGPALQDIEFLQADYEVARQVEGFYLSQLRIDADMFEHDFAAVWEPLKAAADA